jgi:hypothetical protein
MTRGFLALGLCACVAACTGGGRGRGDAPDARAPELAAGSASEARYEPATRKARTGAQVAERGTIAGDFDWALASPALIDAIERWREFLVRHRPKDGSYEDGFHARHVRAAELELLRAYYLAGRIQEGDSLLHQLVDDSPPQPPP